MIKLSKNSFLLILMLLPQLGASSIIPIGNENTALYYKIGGANDFVLPPVSTIHEISLNSQVNLGIGDSCSSFNPALSILNSLNNLSGNFENIVSDIVRNATGSLMQWPMYQIAKRNPTLYALLNNKLINANKRLQLSTKSCEEVRDQIASGQNPYQGWATISINDQWKKELSLIKSDPNHRDINDSKKNIDSTSGDEGVAWVSGKNTAEGKRAGGKGQPPVNVIKDTTKAGYNAMLNRDLQSSLPAPKNEELAKYFPVPNDAVNWMVYVVGDQRITTCNDTSCKNNQGSVIGHGLRSQIMSCEEDNENCVATIRDHLANLISGNEQLSKPALERVSGGGIAMSPEVIYAIRDMDAATRGIIVNKLAGEIALHRLIDKAMIARNILTAGAQVPVISANNPAQLIIGRAITNIDNDLRSLVFESQIRKQTVSNTIGEILQYAEQQKLKAASLAPVIKSEVVMENGAVRQ